MSDEPSSDEVETAFQVMDAARSVLDRARSDFLIADERYRRLLALRFDHLFSRAMKEPTP